MSIRLSTQLRNFRLLTLISILPICLTAKGQTCSTSTTPTLNGQSWKDNSTKNVYVDPTLPAAMQTSIKQAASDFGSQTGEPINLMSVDSSDPGTGAQDAIRIMNNSPGSPTNFAYTSANLVYSNGVATTLQISATISFNIGANLAAATATSPAVPYYSAAQPNAAQYLYDVTLHELGHAFGMNDAPVPNDPATGHPDYSLQPAGASIMNGGVNTNDQGPHGPTNAPQPGGVGATSVQPCDKKQITTANPVVTTIPSDSGTRNTGAAPVPVASPPSGSGTGSGISCNSYEEWDDSTNSLTTYTDCEITPPAT